MKPLEIKEKREKLGLTQEELAKSIGVSKNTVFNYEKGKVIPDSKIELLEKILNSTNPNIVNEPITIYRKKEISFEEKRKLIEEEIRQINEVIKHKLEIIELLKIQIEVLADTETDRKKKDY